MWLHEIMLNFVLYQIFLTPGDTSSLDFRERHPPLTRDTRAQTVNLLPEVPPEYKLIEKYNIISVSGEQHMSRGTALTV